MYSVFADMDGIGRGASFSSSNSPDSIPTPVSTKRMRYEYSPVSDNPRWIDFRSPPKINIQQPNADDREKQHTEKDMEDLEALLRRVS